MNMIHVLVDAGHGSNTSGKGSPYSLSGVLPELSFREWKWCREMAGMIVNGLKELGIQAEILVPENYDVSLQERVKRVNQKCQLYGKNNVILLSIHNNALGMGDKWMNNASGWSAWTSVGHTKSDILAEFLYDAARIYLTDMSLRVDKADNDSDYESQFFILRKTLCTAVLTENLFMTSEKDVRFLLSEEGKMAIAKTHIIGTLNYIKSL